MAAFAVIEVCLAKGALAVVAGHAGLRASVGKMLCGDGRADLARLGKPAPADRVAVFAVEVATHVVIGVAETQTKGARCSGRRIIAARAVTRPA